MSIILLSDIMQFVILRNAILLSVILINEILISVILLCVIRTNVVAPMPSYPILLFKVERYKIPDS